MLTVITFLLSLELQAQNLFTIRSERIALPAEQLTSSLTRFSPNSNSQGQDFLSQLELLGPGIEVNESGTFGSQASLMLRGSGRGFSQINFEGIELNDASDIDQSFQPQLIPSSFIGSGEVMRGIQSGLYGSDAIGGVVSLNSPQFEQSKSSIQFSAGSYDHLNFGAQFLTKKSKLLMNYESAEGPSSFNQRKKVMAEKDNYRSLNAFASHEEKYLGHLFFVKGLFLNNDKEIDGGFPFVDKKDDDQSHITSSHFVAGMKKERTALTYQIQLQTGKIERDIDNQVYEGKTNEINGEVGYLFSKKFSSLAFIEISENRAEIENDFSDKEVTNYALGITNHQNFQKLFFSQTARLDHHSKFENEMTYKLGAGLRITSLTTLKANYATGYKAPTLYQLYTNQGGDENLNPTSAKGFDIGINQKTYSGEIDLTYFETKLTEQIDYNLNTSQYLNITKSSQKGVEVSYKQELSSKLRFDLNATRLWAVNEITGSNLYNRADLTAALKIHFIPHPNHQLSLLNYYKGKRFDSTGEMPPYHTLGLSGSHQLSNDLNAYWLVRNILDRKYEDVRNYGTLERSFLVGIKRAISL